MAVLGLAVVGTAGAFGYRAMFGGSVLPQLPPIIKANGAPEQDRADPARRQRIRASRARWRAAGQTCAAAGAAGRSQPPKPAPRVVSTIPVIGTIRARRCPRQLPHRSRHARLDGSAAAPGLRLRLSRLAGLAGIAACLRRSSAPPACNASAAPQTSAEPKKSYTPSRSDTDQPTGNACRRRRATAAERAAARRAATRRSRSFPGGGDTAAEPAPPRSHAAPPAMHAPLTVASAGPATARRGHPAAAVTPCRFPRSAARPRPKRPSTHCAPSSRAAWRPRADRSPRRSRRQGHLLSRPGRPVCLDGRKRQALCSSLKAAGGTCIVQRN